MDETEPGILTSKEVQLEESKKDFNSISELSAILDEKIRLLEEKEAQWRALEKSIQDNINKAKSRIKLDIGGKLFSTSKSTLVAIEGTYFHSLLGNEIWKPEDDGCYFIDRNPKYFDRILNYLRTGHLDWSGLNDAGRKKLQEDLDYYQIPGVEPTAKWNPEAKSHHITLSDGNATATKTGPNGWNAAVLGTHAVISVTYRVNNFGNSGSVMVGLSPKLGYQLYASNYSGCGYYIHLRDGKLYSKSIGGTAKIFGPIYNGSTIQMIYDQDCKTISISVNGNQPELSFPSTTGDLYPAIDLFETGTSISILPSD